MEKNANYALVGMSSLILFVGLVIFVIWLARMQFTRDYDLYDISVSNRVVSLETMGPHTSNGGPAELLGQRRRIGHEAPRLRVLPEGIHARQPALAGQLGHALPLREQEGVARHEHGVHVVPGHGREGAPEVVAVAYLDELDA